jgi:hypothetical protein
MGCAFGGKAIGGALSRGTSSTRPKQRVISG